MQGALNPYLVTMSIAVAVLTSYTMLDMSSRIRRMELAGKRRLVWLAGGALSLGNGIWSMHFIGMLACPMRMNYDPAPTLLSWCIAVFTAILALHLTTHRKQGRSKLAFGALLMGIGIVGMHYLGMSAMRVYPGIRYDPRMFSISVAIALSASWVAQWIAFHLGADDSRWLMARRGAASLVMGAAIAGMHYVGMAAAIFSPNATFDTVHGIDTNLLAILVSVWSICTMTASLVIAMVGSRFEQLHLPAVMASGMMLLRDGSTMGLDPVTGIMDRGTFLELAERRVSKGAECSEVFGVMFLDLDCFKTVNDSLGYAAGDELLRAFVADLAKRVRPDTAVGRMGGDEFIVLLDNTKDSGDVVDVARSIFGRLQQSFQIDGMPLRVTASAGVAVYPEHGSTAGTLMKSANLAMHYAKQRGKNTCLFFEPAMSDAASRTLQMTRGLSEALEKRQFSLVFQPKFDGRHYRISGAEALIRWHHPLMGTISPMEFIPAAEQSGQILAISEWVIGEVCRQMKVWEAAGLPVLRISINLSPEQLRQEHYAERIAGMVMDAGVDPGSILFEITETAAMREPQLAAEVIRDFQRAGFDFAIDDFGTGYSSMAYLQQFRVKELKIDRFFINSLESNGEEGHAIVSAIIALAHALHMTVVAEGVETAVQLQQLSGMDCDEIQGYLLGRPLMPANFESLVRAESISIAALAAERTTVLLNGLASAIA